MKKKQAYLIGIKGVGMTALAVILRQKGFEVSGSDVKEEFQTDKILSKYKIRVNEGFSPEHVNPDLSLVVVTGAHGGMTNVEAKKAQGLGIPTYMHGRYLGKLMEGKTGISVAGCHGKTTTASLIAFLFKKANLDPSYAIGTAEIIELGPAGNFGKGKYFIAEADEYVTCPATDMTPRFLWQKPEIMVITNIEFDHPDVYKNIDEVKEAYISFINNLEKDGILIACIDDHNIQEVIKRVKIPVITYGFSPQAKFQITQYSFRCGNSFMKVKCDNINVGEFMLQIPGKHNLLNALAASIVASTAGVSWEKIANIIKNFKGTKRRFELIGESRGTLFYDDYAHHPSEIKSTLAAARTWFPDRRIIAIFQPHTFSRTKALLSQFSGAFVDADEALIADIYPSARESMDPTINSDILVQQVNKFKKNAKYISTKAKLIEYLENKITEKDIILTMGAGDIYLWQKDLLTLRGKRS